MGTNTNISWCDHTFNPWRGCTKISAGCANCYAEKMSKRNPQVLGEWGNHGKRAMAAESYWKLPERWNAQAQRDGVRRSVFCNSLSDVFEDRPELDVPRLRLFRLIRNTPHLDYLLLTKREIYMKLFLSRLAWELTENGLSPHLVEIGGGTWWSSQLSNVWLGVSAENQDAADVRIPTLLEIPAAVRFVSCEPLLGEIDMRSYLPSSQKQHTQTYLHRGVDWVIAGGESQTGARPMKPVWAQMLRNQCFNSGIPFFFKQHGEYLEKNQVGADGERHCSGPMHTDGGTTWYRVGAKVAGNYLYGVKHEEFPVVSR